VSHSRLPSVEVGLESRTRVRFGVLKMQIRISKQSDVPIREQIAEQIIFLIATEELKPAQTLPSVRELARRLKIHHNTVSRAYADLVRRGWLVAKKGCRLIVRSQDEFTRVTRAQDLDSMINAVIRVAREGGHSLQELRDRVRKRLLAQPPDHLLVIDADSGLRQLLQEEIKRAVPWPLRGCAPADLRATPGLAVGALPVVAQHHLPEVASLLPETRPAISVTYCLADEHLRMIQNLRQPSIVALVSVSEVFLKTARGLLAPLVEGRHTLCEFPWPLKRTADIRVADLVFCDSIAFAQVKHPRRVLYQLIVPSSIAYILTAMEAYQKR
jgi:DNA-binding transcriptional regulator YhcF (GntR family)